MLAMHALSLQAGPVNFTTAPASEEHDLGIVHNVHRHPNVGEIDAILSQYVPPYVLSFLSDEGTKIVPLPEGVTYARASTAIRRLSLGVDGRPVPPAGLFVVEERTVYLRNVSSITVVHELGHALDCVLGGGVYRSSVDPTIRRAFESSTQFVTPYAASGLDEFFAEAWRAYLGANDPHSLWPTVTRARLEACAPTMVAVFEGINAELKRRPAGQVLTTPKDVQDRVIERVDRDAPVRGRARCWDPTR
jgi:hypothetical protein